MEKGYEVRLRRPTTSFHETELLWILYVPGQVDLVTSCYHSANLSFYCYYCYAYNVISKDNINSNAIDMNNGIYHCIIIINIIIYINIYISDMINIRMMVGEECDAEGSTLNARQTAIASPAKEQAWPCVPEAKWELH